MSGESLAHRLIDEMAITCETLGGSSLYIRFGRLDGFEGAEGPHWYICYQIGERAYLPAWSYHGTCRPRPHCVCDRLHAVLLSRISPEIKAQCIAASIQYAAG